MPTQLRVLRLREKTQEESAKEGGAGESREESRLRRKRGKKCFWDAKWHLESDTVGDSRPTEESLLD